LTGVRDASFVMLTDEYEKYGKVHITTEDGSVGEKGFVVHHSVFNRLTDYSMIYTCGPEVMMKAVAKRAQEVGVECEVSLENLMACGVGACLCCVTDTPKGRKCVCTEGPVFNSKDLLW
ncbi:MAG: dihydroorotate dehydrogenase electron transfer subunit, partial [Bacteroidetes bacterium HGW-Bacteroidetes-21]